MIYAKSIFWISALFLSIVTAWHMVNVKGAQAAYQLKKAEEKLVEAELFKKDIFHDRILNLLGILLGYAAVYYFIVYRLGNTLELTDMLIILVAYIGTTGYLPHIIINKGFKP